MRATLKITAFVVTLAVAFAIALGIGKLVGPIGAEPAHRVGAHDDESTADGMAPTQHNRATVPSGLMVSEAGYALRTARPVDVPGRGRVLEFTIIGPGGQPITKFEIAHEKRLHLILVRRDFSGFQHVHPTMDSAGRWSVPVDLTPGSWRLLADFVPSGAEPLTLGADLNVGGPYEPEATPVESRTSMVDGYEVTLGGDLAAGDDAKLTLTVTKEGHPVTDLEPHLGTYGHLVALREGDLAYLHVHPEGTPGDGNTPAGPEVVFSAEVPGAGGYRLFWDFRHEGVVRTATFAVTALDSADNGQTGH